MVSRKTKRKNLKQFLALLVAVAVVVGASVAYQTWWKNRPGKQPEEVKVTATVGDNSQEISPYAICEMGVECPEGDVASIDVGEDDTLTIEVPKDIADHDWTLLKIYDDPAANDQLYYKGNEATSIEVPGSVDPTSDDSTTRPRLVVVEVNSVLIGLDDNGEETPYSVTWSISTEYAKTADLSAEVDAAEEQAESEAAKAAEAGASASESETASESMQQTPVTSAQATP